MWCLFIFLFFYYRGLVFKFGRTEDLWQWNPSLHTDHHTPRVCLYYFSFLYHSPPFPIHKPAPFYLCDYQTCVEINSEELLSYKPSVTHLEFKSTSTGRFFFVFFFWIYLFILNVGRKKKKRERDRQEKLT